MKRHGTATHRLLREYQQLQKQNHEHFVIRPNEADSLSWHFVLHNLPADSPYAGGVYHGKFEFKPDYPFVPPSIYMITPSGRFRTNCRICFSMSDYHPETWQPFWGLENLCIGFVSFMLDESEPETAGGVIASNSERRKLALASYNSNKKFKFFEKHFPEFCDDSKWDKTNGFNLRIPSKSIKQITEIPAPDPATPAPDPDKIPAPDPASPAPDPDKIPAPDPAKIPAPDPSKIPAPDPTPTDPPNVQAGDVSLPSVAPPVIIPQSSTGVSPIDTSSSHASSSYRTIFLLLRICSSAISARLRRLLAKLLLACKQILRIK